MASAPHLSRLFRAAPAAGTWVTLALALALTLAGCGRDEGSLGPVSRDFAQHINFLVDQLTIPTQREEARMLIVEAGVAATPVTSRRMNDPNSVIRWELANLQAEILDARVIPVLAQMVLHDEEEAVTKAALSALAKFDDKSFAAAQFLSAIDSADEETRWKAAIALAHLKDPAGVEILHEALDDKERRALTLQYLGKVFNDESSAAISKGYDSYSKANRTYAVMSLGAIADETAVDVIIRSLKDPAQRIRWRACFCLGRAKDPRAIDALAAVIETETDEQVLKHAKISLSKLERVATAELKSR